MTKKLQTDLTEEEIDELDAHVCFAFPGYFGGAIQSAKETLVPKDRKKAARNAPKDETKIV